MKKQNKYSDADIDLRLVELQRQSHELKQELDQIPVNSFEEAKLSVGIPVPGYRSRSMIGEDIRLTEAELLAWEKKKQEVAAARALRTDPSGKKKPESQVVKEACEKILSKKGVTVEDVFDEVAEILGKTPENVRRLYYYKAKKTPRKV